MAIEADSFNQAVQPKVVFIARCAMHQACGIVGYHHGHAQLITGQVDSNPRELFHEREAEEQVMADQLSQALQLPPNNVEMCQLDRGQSLFGQRIYAQRVCLIQPQLQTCRTVSASRSRFNL